MRRVTHTDTRRAQLMQAYELLRDYYDARGAMPSNTELAELIGQSATATFIRFNEMVALGWIERSGGQMVLKGIR